MKNIENSKSGEPNQNKLVYEKPVLLKIKDLTFGEIGPLDYDSCTNCNFTVHN